MGYLAILIGISVGLWLMLNLIASKTTNWRNGFRYWIACCWGPPLILSLFGLFRLISFVPPTTFDPSVADPGPQNFMIAVGLGFIPAIIYFLTAVVLSALTASRRADL
jgi:hypothetical protein